ncbi:hypothetical protein [Streptomyces venezuelae]|uniref:hypothetical protein n=1 Tax=Streptomyces venezuelae TaxID=54571 RepID=UPI003664D648
MTLAVQGALVLDQMPAAHGTTVGLAYRLRRALAHRLAPAWHSSTLHLRTTGTDQPAPTGLRARLHRHRTARIAAAAPTDPHAATRLVARLQAAGPLAAVPHPRRTPAPAPAAVPAAPPGTTHGPPPAHRPPGTAAAPAAGGGSRTRAQKGRDIGFPA